MRRSRFSVSPGASAADRDQATVREALWFDLRAHENADEESLADWRIAGLDHVAILMGVMHLMITVACIMLSPGMPATTGWDNPLIPAVLTLLLDGTAAAALLKRHRFNVAPHNVIRGLCLYLAATSLMWTWFGKAVEDDAFVIAISAAQVAMVA